METKNLTLNETLAQLEEGRIQKLEFDILQHTIAFVVKVYKSDDDFEFVNVIFSKVSTFYFVNDTGKRRFEIYDPDPEDRYELTSISWYKEGIGTIKVIASASTNNVTWLNYWSSSANFDIELGAAALFIEAQIVSINGKVFEVGRPLDYA